MKREEALVKLDEMDTQLHQAREELQKYKRHCDYLDRERMLYFNRAALLRSLVDHILDHTDLANIPPPPKENST